MECELCHRQKAETVLYRTNPEGKREELYVCRACAERERAFGESRGIQVAAINADAPDQESPLHELFGYAKRLLGVEDEGEGGREKRCPGCGTTMDDIRTIGLIGCPRCYDTFKKGLRALFDECQLTHRYAGEPLPGQAQSTREKELRAALADAIKREDYREAKRLREELGRLQAGEDEHGA